MTIGFVRPSIAAAPEKTTASNEKVLARPANATSIRIGANGMLRWTFSRREDVDFDSWPEGWQRKKDPDHPAYLPMRLAARDESALKLGQMADLRLLQAWPAVRNAIPWLPAIPPSIADRMANHYFRIELDGGWAMVQSPPIAVDPLYRYRMELNARTEKLIYDSAHAELVFLDANGNLLTQHETKSLTGTKSWTKLETELIAVPELAATAAVRLMLRPMKTPGQADIRGAAGFDDIVIQQLPQIRVSTDQRFAVYDQGQQPTITVRVLGMKRDAADVKFVVRDINNQQVALQSVPFEQIESKDSARQDPLPSSIQGVAVWQLPVLRPGYYVIESMLGETDSSLLSNQTTFVVLATLPHPNSVGPYGWTLPRGMESDAEMKRMPDWLSRLGVGVVKYPCWFAPAELDELDAAAWLVGHLQEKNIRIVGLLDKPPEVVRAKIDERERREPVAVNYFRDPAVWQPLIEPIMTRLTLKVRTWQLGTDSDYSFITSPRLKQTIKDIGRELQGFGQPIGIAFSWPWLENLPPVSEQSWAAINLSTNAPPLSVDELEAYLQATEAKENGHREPAEAWVTVDPLDASIYDRQTRIADLVLRMTAVRGYRVPATFVSEPLSPKQGLLRSDYRPGELLLPWRTTAMLVGDLTKVGSLQLPGNSSNVVLSNKERTTIVIWNPTPTTEAMFLGDSTRQIDVWGNVTIPKKMVVDGQSMHAVKVGPMPTFLIDLDPVLVAFQMSTRLIETGLDSLLGRRQSLSIEFVNPTQESLSGEVRMKRLADWEVSSDSQAFDLPAGQTANVSFDVALRNSAKIGTTQLAFDFLLSTQPKRRFSVTRTIHVGPEGLDIEVNTRLDKDELLVDLTLINRTDKQQKYDCMLFPPSGRQYQRRQVVVPALATVKRSFPWPDGQSLIGKEMLLRAVEQDGARVLNQVVVIAP